MPTYGVNVERDGDFLHICVPELDRHTQALEPRDVEAMARGLIAIMEGVPPDSFDIALHDDDEMSPVHDLEHEQPDCETKAQDLRLTRRALPDLRSPQSRPDDR